jgi:hypothetical protein
MSDQPFVETIEQHFHIDGPHNREQVIDAAQCVSSLIRYLNHATDPGPRAERTLEWANTVYTVSGNLTAAAYAQQQLLDQLAQSLDRQAAHDPTLYDDRRDDVHQAAHTAIEAAEELREAAAQASRLGDAIENSRSFSVHLGND